MKPLLPSPRAAATHPIQGMTKLCGETGIYWEEEGKRRGPIDIVYTKRKIETENEREKEMAND